MNTSTENETVTDQPAPEPLQSRNTAPEQPVVAETQDAPPDDDADDDGDSNGEESSEGGRKPKRPRWSDVNRANREALEARRELDELRKQMQPKQEPAAPVQSASADDPFPTLESCDFYSQAHERALRDWNLRQVDAVVARREQERQSQTVAQQRQAAFAAKEAEFIAAHPDYEGVAKAPHVPITQQMAEVMWESPDTAPAIAYYLGQNIEEAARIAQMSPLAQARALGVIEAKVTASEPPKPVPPKPIQKAPPVVPTLQPGASASKDWKQMTTDEHVRAYRERQQAKSSR